MPNETITREYYLKVTVTADRAPMEANNDGPAISTGIFRAFDQWPNHAVTVEEIPFDVAEAIKQYFIKQKQK